MIRCDWDGRLAGGEECRVARVLLCDLTFGMPCLRQRTLYVTYHESKNFNVMPPDVELDDPLPTVYDAAWKHLDGRRPPNTTRPQWPNGWAREHLERCRPKVAEFWHAFDHRLQWLRPAPRGFCFSTYMHPWFERPLEYNELQAFNRDELIHDWIKLQFTAWREDFWEDQDWESAYDSKKRQWIGGNVEPGAVKTFDLRQYHPQHFNLEDYDEDARTPLYR